MGVVVVSSMMRYSRGSGRANRVTSPYSSLVWKEKTTSKQVNKQINTNKQITYLHLPYRRRQEHTAPKWILVHIQVLEHLKLAQDSHLLPEPYTDLRPGERESKVTWSPSSWLAQFS